MGTKEQDRQASEDRQRAYKAYAIGMDNLGKALTLPPPPRSSSSKKSGGGGGWDFSFPSSTPSSFTSSSFSSGSSTRTHIPSGVAPSGNSTSEEDGKAALGAIGILAAFGFAIAVFSGSSSKNEPARPVLNYPAITLHLNDDPMRNRAIPANFFGGRDKNMDVAQSGAKSGCAAPYMCRPVASIGASNDKQCIIAWGGDFNNAIAHVVLTGSERKDAVAKDTILKARKNYARNDFRGICNSDDLIPYAQKIMAAEGVPGLMPTRPQP